MKKHILYNIFIVISVLSQSQNVVRMEYFIDTDPGYGNGISNAISPAPDIDFTFNVDASGLTIGYHNLYSRFLDSNLSWSQTMRYQFEVIKNEGLSYVVSLEWAFNEDQGIGNCDSVVIFNSPSPDSSFTFNLPVDAFPNAIDTVLYLRVKNSPELAWSHTAIISDLEIIFVSIDQSIISEINIFPNPAVDKINIINNNTALNDYIIMDVYGNILIKQQIQANANNIVKISQLPAGVYLLTIVGSNSPNSITKFVKL